MAKSWGSGVYAVGICCTSEVVIKTFFFDSNVISIVLHLTLAVFVVHGEGVNLAWFYEHPYCTDSGPFFLLRKVLMQVALGKRVC